MASKSGSGFACMECGHKFKTLKAAEKASFGPNGCPKCGGADIDLSPIGLGSVKGPWAVSKPASAPKPGDLFPDRLGTLPPKPTECKCAICTNESAWASKK